MDQRLTLSVLKETFGVCRLERGAQLPAWILALDLFSVTRTREELSIVVPEDSLQLEELPPGAVVEGGWACLKVEGMLDLSLVGVMAALSGALAAAEISLFAISTYDTDYLLVREEALECAAGALSEAGHAIKRGL